MYLTSRHIESQHVTELPYHAQSDANINSTYLDPRLTLFPSQSLMMIDALHRLIPSLNSNKTVQKLSDLCETTEMANLGSRQRMAGKHIKYQCVLSTKFTLALRVPEFQLWSSS